MANITLRLGDISGVIPNQPEAGGGGGGGGGGAKRLPPSINESILNQLIPSYETLNECSTT